MPELNEQDSAFLVACAERKIERAKQLVADGANPLARDASGTALHQQIPYIAVNWPRTRPLLESLLEMGLSLNRNGDDDLVFGTPMHQLGKSINDPNIRPHYDAVNAFITEAVQTYDADLSLTRTYQQFESELTRTMMDECLLNGHTCLPVLKTLMRLDDNPSPEQQDRLASQWCSLLLYSGTTIHPMQALLEMGAPVAAMDDARANNIGFGGAVEQARFWEEQNPYLAPETLRSKSELFCERTSLAGRKNDALIIGMPEHWPEIVRYQSSPLLNPKNWQQMPALASKLESLGTPITPDDLLSPCVDGASALEVGVGRCGQAKAAMALCHAAGLQLGAAELLEADGTPNRLLSAFIESNQTCELFTEENWTGKPKAELRQVVDALPRAQREQVRNLHTLNSTIDRASRAERAIG